MLSSSKEKIETAKKCLENLEASEHEILIAIYGNDMTEQQKTDFRRMILASFPSTELFEIDGGQDVYDFILILE
jgi:dihydroxyacetone kinase-like predicted kinase